MALEWCRKFSGNACRKYLWRHEVKGCHNRRLQHGQMVQGIIGGLAHAFSKPGALATLHEHKCKSQVSQSCARSCAG